MPPPSKEPKRFNAYQRAYRAKNREKWREYGRAWAAANAEKEQERKRLYRERNREAIRAKARERMRAARAANPTKAAEYAKSYRANNPEKVKQWYANKSAVRRGAMGAERISAECWMFIKAMHGDRCAYCHTGDDKLQMDHVVALSRGGTHTIGNVVPACGPCNNSKNARGVYEWIESFRSV